MSTHMPRFRQGDKFKLSPDALENYEGLYATDSEREHLKGVFTVTGVYTHYCETANMHNDPTGHPGFDSGANSPLYGSAELHFDLYEWEMVRA